jgi:hypothetical protein
MQTDPEQNASGSGPNPLLIAGICLALVVGGLASAVSIVGAAVWLHRAPLVTTGTPVQREAAVTLVPSLSAQVVLYTLQHADRPPDFATYSRWEQLTGITDNSGRVLASKPQDVQTYGPYLDTLPRNPLNGLITVAVVQAPPEPGDRVPGGAPAGFVFSIDSGKVYVTDATGARVIDPAAGPVPDRSIGFRTASPGQQRKALKDFSAVVTTVRAQVRLYVAQHGESYPDFEIYPDWEQMVARTDPRGNILPNGPFGPYFRAKPCNPVNGQSKVQVAQQTVDSTFRADPGVGFVLDPETLTIWGVDPDGAIVPDAATSSQPAPAFRQ